MGSFKKAHEFMPMKILIRVSLLSLKSFVFCVEAPQVQKTMNILNAALTTLASQTSVQFNVSKILFSCTHQWRRNYNLEVSDKIGKVLFLQYKYSLCRHDVPSLCSTREHRLALQSLHTRQIQSRLVSVRY